MNRINRTALMAVLVLASSLLCQRDSFAEERLSSKPDEALQLLLDGNQRFTAGESVHPGQSGERRSETANGQKPVAAVLSCADSRVPPEVIFDQGLGDIFTVRVAGHVLDNTSLGSLEYAVEHLGVSLIVVLGHERCGAVGAALTAKHLPGHLVALTERIKPAIEKVRTSKSGEPDVESCVHEHSKLVAEELRKAPPVISSMVQAGKVKVVSGRYDLDTGVVEIH